MDIDCIVNDVFSEYNVNANTADQIAEDIKSELKKEMSIYLNELMGDFDGQDAYGIIEQIREDIC